MLRRWSGCLITLTLVSLATAQAPSASQTPGVSLDKHLPSSLDISTATVQTLVTTPVSGVRDGGVARQPIGVLLGDEQISLDLSACTIRSDRFELLVQDESGLRRVAPPAPKTYEGMIVGEPGSRVVASGVRGGLRAMIRRADGTEWGIEPIGLRGAGSHAVFRRDDSLPLAAVCGSDGPSADVRVGGVAMRGPTIRQLDLAIEADADYFAFNGTIQATMEDLEGILQAVSDMYERDLSVRFELTTVVIRAVGVDEDPYNETAVTTMLDELEAVWGAQFSGVERDLVHMLTGRDIQGSFIGVAETGQVCSRSFGFGLAQTNYSGNIFWRRALTAHEIGHNFNASHCDPNAGCEIMCSTIGGCGIGFQPDLFGPTAMSQIMTFRDSTEADCLIELAPPLSLPFSETFPGQSLNTDHWTFASNFRVTTDATNEPSQPSSIQLSANGPGEFDQAEVRSNTILLGSAGAPVVRYRTEHKGVEAGEALIVEALIVTGDWFPLNRIESDGEDQIWFASHEHMLSPALVDDTFRLRFRTEVTDGGDLWYVDNVVVEDTGTPVCPCEMNFDETIDITDLLVYLDLWLVGDPSANLDADAEVNVLDLLSFLDCWLGVVAEAEPCP